MKTEPHYFTIHDFVKAIFGAFLIGITFIFKSGIFDYAKQMSTQTIITIMISTGLLVTLEIYALSYKFVKDRKQRPFHEFWAKRFFAITIASFAAIYLTTYIYGLNSLLTPLEIFKLATAVFLPAATFGAAIEMLKSKL